MKTIQIARDVFDFLAAKAAETGEAPATQPHRLHTGGTPFPHPATDIQPGQSADFTLVSPHDPAIAGPLFDHTTGQQARFFIVVKPAL